jgi:thermitase
MRQLLIIAALLLAAPATARAAEGDIIVQRAPGLDAGERKELREDAGVELVETLPLERTDLVRAADPAEALAALRADGDVVYAEPDRRVSLQLMPDDSYFGSLWALHNTGQSVGGQAGSAGDDIDATAAWDRTEGAGVTVAVVDTGVKATHVDLVDQITGNAAEIGGAAGVDDDHNGFVDDYRGWDFVDADNLPQDGHGHGTHVSGTIAAEGQSNVGVVGVAPQAKVMPLRALGNNGSGWMSNIAAAFDYAGDLGVRVVNASLGGPYSFALESAIAAHPNTLYVVAAGNDAANADTDSDAFPCAIAQPNVVCVGATDNRDEIASFSNYGATAVDLFAPGVAIYSTYKSSSTSYALMDGTSMAAPHVAGAAALALSANPAASTAFLRSSLLSSVDAKPQLAGNSVTGGRLNANSAVNAIQGVELTPTPTPTPEAPVETPTPETPVAPPAPVDPGVTPVPTTTPTPVLTNLTIRGSLRTSSSKLRVSFRLARATSVRFTVKAKVSKKTLASWTRRGRAGANAFTLTHRLGGKTLKPGVYKLAVTAS